MEDLRLNSAAKYRSSARLQNVAFAGPPLNNRAMSRRSFLFVIGAALAMAVLILFHAPYVTGPRFFSWPYRTLAATQTYGMLALAGVPILGSCCLTCRTKRSGFLILLLLMGGCSF